MEKVIAEEVTKLANTVLAAQLRSANDLRTGGASGIGLDMEPCTQGMEKQVAFLLNAKLEELCGAKSYQVDQTRISDRFLWVDRLD